MCSCNASLGRALPGRAAPWWGCKGGTLPSVFPAGWGEAREKDGWGRKARTPGQLQARLRSRLPQRHQGDLHSPLAQLLARWSPQRYPSPQHVYRAAFLVKRNCITCLSQTGKARDGGRPCRARGRASNQALPPSSPAGNPPHPQSRLDSALPFRIDPEKAAAISLRFARCSPTAPQHPGAQRGSDGSWQIWDGTCPTFTEQAG